jgi:hypothetical protein
VRQKLLSTHFSQQCLKEKKKITKERDKRNYDKERYHRRKETISIQRKEKYLKNSNSEKKSFEEGSGNP